MLIYVIRGFIDQIIMIFLIIVDKKFSVLYQVHNKVSQIDFLGLKKNGKIGIIFDIDDTLAIFGKEIEKENEELIISLNKLGFKTMLYSNSRNYKRTKRLEENGSLVLKTDFAKPSIYGFNQAIEKLGLSNNQIVMIGDNIVTDGGVIKLGIDFILIKDKLSKTKNIGFLNIVKLYGNFSKFIGYFFAYLHGNLNLHK